MEPNNQTTPQQPCNCEQAHRNNRRFFLGLLLITAAIFGLVVSYITTSYWYEYAIHAPGCIVGIYLVTQTTTN